MFNIIKQSFAYMAAAVCVFILWQQISDDRNYTSWPTAQARLISAEVVVGSSGLIRQPRGKHFLVEATYDFSVDGKVYRSGANKIGVPRFDTDTEALRYLDKLKSSPELLVHYHPRTPEKNTLSQVNLK